ncbi:MAG: hypothetical protein KGL39_45670 [Patescibacteria group bacterium]|nr:hypothetical protein [Patescibacteria group bacterium]
MKVKLIMNAKTKHTPTPWFYHKGMSLAITNDSQWPKGQAVLQGDEFDLTDEDGEFIVRACNEHAALVAVAEAAEKARLCMNPLLAALPYGNEPLDIKAREIQASLKQALANLAAVRKGAQ